MARTNDSTTPAHRREQQSLYQQFDLNLLRVAVAVQDAGSVTGAAQLLGSSQPSVSMAIGRLRAVLGDPVFVRSPLGMTATPRALRLISAVRPLITEINHGLLHDEEFDPKSTRTTFTFAMSDVGEMVFLPRLLERIQAFAPLASVSSVAMKPRDLERALEQGDVDLAVGYFPDLQHKAVMQQRLFAHHFTCLVSASHPVLRAGLTREAFLQLKHAVVHPEGRSQEIFERFLISHRIKRDIV